MEMKASFRQGLIPEKQKNRVPLPVISEPSFEACIEEFIWQYLIQNEINKNSLSKPYRAFIRMFCYNVELEGSNFVHQKKLYNFAKKLGYSCGSQEGDGRIPFIHIDGEDSQKEYKWPNMVKLYLNCDRRNIALLATEVLKKIHGIAGTELHMKFSCEQIEQDCINNERNAPIKNYQRNDKIVIYAKNQEKALQYAEAINEIRKEHPELFLSQKKVPNMLPFIPKAYGIMGIAAKKPADYIRIPAEETGEGEYYINGSTYNEFIANLFEYCIVAGFDEAVGQFKDKTKDVGKRMDYYASEYSSLNQNEKAIVHGKIKRIFEKICIANNIKTSYTEHLLDQNKESRYR